MSRYQESQRTVSPYQRLITDRLYIRKIIDQAFAKTDIEKNSSFTKPEISLCLDYIARNLGLESPTAQDIADVLMALESGEDTKITKSDFQELLESVIQTIAKEGQAPGGSFI